MISSGFFLSFLPVLEIDSIAIHRKKKRLVNRSIYFALVNTHTLSVNAKATVILHWILWLLEWFRTLRPFVVFGFCFDNIDFFHVTIKINVQTCLVIIFNTELLLKIWISNESTSIQNTVHINRCSIRYYSLLKCKWYIWDDLKGNLFELGQYKLKLPIAWTVVFWVSSHCANI